MMLKITMLILLWWSAVDLILLGFGADLSKPDRGMTVGALLEIILFLPVIVIFEAKEWLRMLMDVRLW